MPTPATSASATAEEGDLPLGNALTDLMTSLAVIFILLLVVYLNRSYHETHVSGQTLRQELLAAFRAKHIAAQADPDDPLAAVIQLRDDTLSFDHDKSLLKPAGAAYLRWFGPAFSEVLCTMQPQVESVLIQGFTDADGNDAHNLALSQNRAFTVLSFLLGQAPLKPAARHCLLGLASTNGMGERGLLPLQPGGAYARSGQENKALSRRVEFRVRLKSFERRGWSTATFSKNPAALLEHKQTPTK
jgi:outer membrane protein OmpA-like peptidoglycan-associated protein